MTSGSKRSKPNMIWTKRILLALPFAAAAALTVLINVADRLHLHREHISGYGFLFATPWAWLLDRGWFGDVRSRWAQEFIAYAVILWIPALLYSGSLWLLLRGFGFGAVQVVGCILASYGTMYSESAFVRGSWLCGFLLLLPGNLPAMALDQTLWHIQTGKIFFPVAVGCNALFWIICSAVWRIVRG